jgi:hypothetical protein
MLSMKYLKYCLLAMLLVKTTFGQSWEVTRIRRAGTARYIAKEIRIEGTSLRLIRPIRLYRPSGAFPAHYNTTIPLDDVIQLRYVTPGGRILRTIGRNGGPLLGAYGGTVLYQEADIGLKPSLLLLSIYGGGLLGGYTGWYITRDVGCIGYDFTEMTAEQKEDTISSIIKLQHDMDDADP